MFAAGFLAGSIVTFIILALFGADQQKKYEDRLDDYYIFTEQELLDIKHECYQKGKEDGQTIGSLPVCKN